MYQVAKFMRSGFVPDGKGGIIMEDLGIFKAGTSVCIDD
jgi:hypothetical protein